MHVQWTKISGFCVSKNRGLHIDHKQVSKIRRSFVLLRRQIKSFSSIFLKERVGGWLFWANFMIRYYRIT